LAKRNELNRRTLLKISAGASLGVFAGTAVPARAQSGMTFAASPTAARAAAFVDDYTTNTSANLTVETNAAVRILSGLQRIWNTGDAWNTGTPLMPDVLRANMRYVARTTGSRTDAQARLAFIVDRRHQSHAVIDGLGPLAELYTAGAKAVTNITSAPDGTPPTKISDAVPADAPPGSAIGAGATDSELGAVATLVNTVRGPFASSNPSKYAYQYPRPWRLNEDSQVVDTGALDDLGYPRYESDVVAPAQLLRQRSETPADDGGYVSGHANALYLAALALAYAIPERFQELVACASDYSHTRIVAGMHSPVDVVGGRILATAMAAATLHDPQYAELKAAARSQAAAYFRAKTGLTAEELIAFAHSAGLDTDPYADRDRNRAAVTPRLTYILPRTDPGIPMVVPKGAEVLLETRLPYLTAQQRREVLRTTSLPPGYVLLQGPEQWGRLNLFAAADGYGAFAHDVFVTMNAGQGGFAAADTWRNDISGRGALIKQGTGSLTLAGANSYTGGTLVRAGTLVAGSIGALGTGDVAVRGGTLRLARTVPVRVSGSYGQSARAVLSVVLSNDGHAPLTVSRSVALGRGSVLAISLDGDRPPALGRPIPVLRTGRLSGTFGGVTVDAEGYEAVPMYSATGMSVRLRRTSRGGGRTGALR
jgi:autotransporter-associated beta strand protein